MFQIIVYIVCTFFDKELWYPAIRLVGVWTYSDLMIRFDYDYHVIQARAEGGAEGAWAPAPLPKVPFCQGNFFIIIFY